MKTKIITGLILFFGANYLFAQSPYTQTKTATTSFIENKGQIIDQDNNLNPAVLYLLNTPGFNVQLRKGGFSYDVYTPKSPEGDLFTPLQGLEGEPATWDEVQFHRIDFDLIGCNPNCEIITTEPSPDYLNYYTVGTPEKGVTRVRSYKKITYKDIYPGIDVEFLVDENHRFEYNFLVHPGGNIAFLQIQILGSQKIKEIPNGLSVTTTIGIIDELIPLCFYRMNDISFPVKGKFSKKEEDIYGFVISESIPEYAELIIDPIPTRRWGTYYGGDDGELIFNNSCAVDNLGNVLLGGSTNSLSNIATLGAFQTVLGGGTDGFLAKFNANGQRMWATYYGGNAGDRVDACAVDQWGNIFIAGFTSSNSNIASPGAFQTVLRGGIDSFVAKFDPAGIRLWGTYYGGNEIQPLSGDWFQACETDTSGSIYCAGETGAPDFIATPGALQTTLFGLRDGFLVKFTGEGERVWATYYGGSGMEENTGCTVSKNGLVYLSGTTESPENISTPGSFLPTLGSSPKGFLACFNLDGQRLWGTYFGGDGSDESYGCAADTGSHVYLYGVTNSLNNIATPGVYQAAKIGTGTDAFLNKFNSSGGRLWGTYFGAGSTDIQGAAVDDSGYVYVTGISNTQDTLIFSPSAYLTIKRGEYGNAVLAKFTGIGDRVWSTYYGGTVVDRGV
ncbi:MAG: hypothetical protein HQ542_09830, partial [Bacteroidia bacterium]|nr:hypothetical protein [Bacteroidia bacterium]